MIGGEDDGYMHIQRRFFNLDDGETSSRDTEDGGMENEFVEDAL